MTCKFEELVSRYLDDDLSPRETGEVENHIARCQSCRLFLHETRSREEAFRKIMHRALSALQVDQKVMRRIRASKLEPETQITHRSTFRRIFTLKTVCAVVSLCLLCLWLLTRSSDTGGGREYSSYGDCISVQAFGGDALYNGTILKENVIMPVEIYKMCDYSGQLGFIEPDSSNAAFSWSGSGTFALASNSISWQSGSGEFKFLKDSYFINLGENGIIKTEPGKLAISGGSTMETRIEQLEGKSILTSREGIIMVLYPGDSIDLRPKSSTATDIEPDPADYSGYGELLPASETVVAVPEPEVPGIDEVQDSATASEEFDSPIEDDPVTNDNPFFEQNINIDPESGN